MKKVVIIISLLLILTAFKTPKNITKTISKNKAQKTIALIHHKYLYFIRVKLNNRNAMLLVDTGASASLLDINQANDYKFKYYLREDKFSGVGGYRISNYKFHHDSISLKIYPFGADLKEINESFIASGIDVAGVIGSDFLTAHDAIIDYKKLQLIIHN
jgi:lipoate-protein ligase A